jgi:hypothetical protein
LIGHGIIAVPTVILLTDRQAVVVQASTTHLCGDRIDVHPLCADPVALSARSPDACWRRFRKDLGAVL